MGLIELVVSYHGDIVNFLASLLLEALSDSGVACFLHKLHVLFRLYIFW